ncbi:MAG: hypothetical protein H6Q38_1516 [Chloroflexi bacterium]|nr:hypothetical protein [Chloroflexota bacterium]
MPKTRISCPNCRQPVVAEIDQLIDVGQDPSAKQRLLSGAFNLIQCPTCGYQGSAATVLVYHDPAKELLLTYVPPEMGLPMSEQERMLGGLINQVVNHLPQEKRKAYLLRPQTMLTAQYLVERVLEADGITKEMIQAQQQRLLLLQRLASASSPEVQAEIARQENALIDGEFFTLLHRLMETAAMSGDQASAKKLDELQNTLLQETTFGKELLAQSQEVQAAVQSLQALGKDLTREKLLELMIDAPNETRLQALVSLTRPALDYSFFQALSDRIDRARGDGRNRLVDLRASLLEFTQEIDKQVEERRAATRKLLDLILDSPEPEETLMQNLPAIDEFFMQEIQSTLEAARKQGDLEKIAKIQTVVDILNQMSTASPEIKMIEELLDVPDGDQQAETWHKILSNDPQLVTPDFLNTLAGVASQVQESGDEVLAARVKNLNRLAIRFSMEREMRGG